MLLLDDSIYYIKLNSLAKDWQSLQLQKVYILNKVKWIGILSWKKVPVYLRFSHEMPKKSIIVGLPILLFNQNKYCDICKYLENLENLFFKIFIPASEPPGAPGFSPTDLPHRKDRTLTDVKVPLRGYCRDS